MQLVPTASAWEARHLPPLRVQGKWPAFVTSVLLPADANFPADANLEANLDSQVVQQKMRQQLRDAQTNETNGTATEAQRRAAYQQGAAFSADFFREHPEKFSEFMAYMQDVDNGTVTSRVRLQGLRGAAHLNGREGTLHGRSPGSSERYRVVLDDGKEVSVKNENYRHLL